MRSKSIIIFLKFALVFLSCITFEACHDDKSSQTKSADTSDKDRKAKVQDITTLRLGLLDNNLSKVYDLFGQPNDKGLTPSLRKGHLIYYNKVLKNGKLQHLVILYGYSDNANSMIVKDVAAVEDRGYYHDSSYGGFVVSEPQQASSDTIHIESLSEQIYSRYIQLHEDTLQSFSGKFYGKNATFYYDSNFNLRLIREEFVFSASRGGVRKKAYYFENNRLKFTLQSDNLYDIPTAEEYYQDDKNIRSVIGDKVVECNYDCSLTSDSHAYRMLAAFKSRLSEGE